ncbi:MAG: DUF2270 domain-containing protein [Anaerolineae bacterium]|nr:DUF2270 domain-containing protein [Anaerolineae bacterium]
MPVKSTKPTEEEQPQDPEEPVWTYRGYKLKTSEFVTAMVHFFRAEVTRANVWRQRLDTTTNWAVVATGATLSIAFSQPNIHHGIIILNTMLVTLFLYIEARRYRYYELWSYRVRLMETDFFAAMLVPPFHPAPDWAESLAENLLLPSFPISMWEAFGRRLRRNYLWIFLILAIAWVAKYWLFPVPPADMKEFIGRAAIGHIPGSIVISISIAYFLFLILVAVLTVNMTRATGEVFPRFTVGEQDLRGDQIHPTDELKGIRSWLAPRKKRRQFLAFIVTGNAKAVADRILSDMGRGVTAVEGKGMYTGAERTVLMCALTVTEVHNLEASVAREDPQAFVVVSPAHEVLGRGFNPLAKED